MAEFSAALLFTAFWLAALVVAMVFIILVTQGFKIALRRRTPVLTTTPRVETFMPSEERGAGLEEMAAAIAAVATTIGEPRGALPLGELRVAAASPWKVAGRLASLRTFPREEQVKS